MARESKTSTIDRPRRVRTTTHTKRGSSRLADLTRPIRADRQLVTRRRFRVSLAVATLAVIGVLGAYLFVFPVQAYLRQQDELAAKQAELEVLIEANRALTAEVRRLQTEDGAVEAARDELGVVAPGEERISVLPSDVTVLPLPTGFPYDAVAALVAFRLDPPPPPAPPAPTAVTAVPALP